MVEKQTRQTLSILVKNNPGVLSQICRLFSRKGYNIETLAAGPTTEKDVTRITVDILVYESQLELLCNQINKLYCVYSVKWQKPETSIRRELVLIKTAATNSEDRNFIIQTANIFRASIIDVAEESLTIAMIGDENKIAAIQNLLSSHGIVELARTGCVALERGQATISEDTKEKGEFNYGKNVL